MVQLIVTEASEYIYCMFQPDCAVNEKVRKDECFGHGRLGREVKAKVKKKSEIPHLCPLSVCRPGLPGASLFLLALSLSTGTAFQM